MVPRGIRTASFKGDSVRADTGHPVQLDDAEIPSLLSVKKCADLRGGMSGAAIEELVQTILDGRSAAVIRRLLPGKEDPDSAGYEFSLLSMIIAKMIHDYPVAAISRERILNGRSILDLYRTVEMMIMNYEDLCDEIIDILDVEDGSYLDFSPRQFHRANRRLLDIANDMRDLARSLDGIVGADSPLRQRLAQVLELCTQISVIEDFLIIRLGAPAVLPERPMPYDPTGPWSVEELHREKVQFPVDDGHLNRQDAFIMVADLERMLRELNMYKVQLRSAIAAAREQA